MTRLMTSYFVPVLILGLLTITGCDNAKPTTPAKTVEHEHGHDHDHDHGTGKKQEAEEEKPESFGETVEYVAWLDQLIENAFAKKDMDAAHGPVHDIGQALEWVEEYSQKAELSAENRESVKSAIKTLFDAYGEIDKNWHGGKGASYTDKKPAIKPAINTLVKIAGVEIPPVEPETQTEAKPADQPEKTKPKEVQ